MRKKNVSKKHTVITGIIFITGLLVLLYPSVSNRWNTWRQKKLLVHVDGQIKNIPDTEKEKDLEKARSYNKTLENSVVPDVFAIREGIKDKDYESLLNPCKDGVMGAVQIPKIKVDIPIYHYTTEKVLLEGAGHIFGSSLPVGGKNTHSLISAHRGLPSAKMFTDLDLIKEGDHFYINVLDKKLAYEVDKIDTVEPNDTRSLSIQKNKDYVTLVTCTPYGINTKRLLVRGHRIPFDKKGYHDEGKKHASNLTRVFGKAVCICIGLLLAYLIQKLIDKYKKTKMMV